MLFGVLGYLMKKFDYELTPLVFLFILGPILEQSLRRSLMLSGGSFLIFFTRPVSASLLILAGLVILSYFFFRRQTKAVVEGNAN